MSEVARKMRHARRRLDAPSRRLSAPESRRWTSVAVAALFSVLPAHVALAEETVFFSELSTPELLELTADLGDILRRRGVLPGFKDPTDAYAAYLGREALDLTPDLGALVDPSGARIGVVGVRRLDPEAAARTGPLGDVDAASIEKMLVIVFQRDFSIERAALAPLSVVKGQMRAADATAEPTLEIDDAFWRAAGVEDVTAQLFIAAAAAAQSSSEN